MSNLFYPLGLIQELDTKRQDRTLVDAFENGTTNSRTYWAAQNFKRIFQLTHAPLKKAEWKYLRSFYSQRSGQYDSFWFRDNLARGGNALVRFNSTLDDEAASNIVMVQNTKINLAEVAPIRALPEWDEMTVAAGNTPVLWYDANREYYLQHLGAVILDPSGAAWDVMENYRPVWQSGTNLNLNFAQGQYQAYHFSSVEWAKTAANITQLAGSQPAFTVFCIAKHSAAAAYQVLFGLGSASANSGIGLALDASNNYTGWVGGSVTTATQSNAVADTWRSLCVTSAASTGLITFYTNAASVGTNSTSRSLVAGPFALGSAPNGTLISNPTNSMANAELAHVLVFAGALSLAQIKAVHNLLGYQYGLATV